MPISRERFAQGLTPAQFVEQMTRNQERFQSNLGESRSIISDEDRAFFAEHPVAIAAIGEDWCTDVVQFLPPVIDLAEACPDVSLSIFLRDQNEDLIDQYLKQGKFRSIPVFVLYDQDWNELGHFSERPEEVTREMAAETRRFETEHTELEGINRSYENMPDATRQAVRENSARFRWDNMLRWNRICLDELRSIAEGAAAKRQAAD